MKTITLNGKDYELVIDGDNIIAQGLTEDLIFNDGYADLAGQAIENFNRYYSNGYPSAGQFSRSEYIAETVENTIWSIHIKKVKVR